MRIEMAWKVKDGAIIYDLERKCFTWLGESANKARASFLKIQREHNLSNDELDYLIIEQLDKCGAGKTNLYTLEK